MTGSELLQDTMTEDGSEIFLSSHKDGTTNETAEAKPIGQIERDPRRPLRFEDVKKYLYGLPINQEALNELTATTVPPSGFFACLSKPRTLRDIPKLDRSRKMDADNIHSWVKT